MLEYRVTAIRRDARGSAATAKQASIELDTSAEGRVDALNPVELLLAGLAACMIKGVERAAPLIGFAFSSVAVQLHAVRQDAPPKLLSIDYELIVDTDEVDRRLQLLHTNVLKYGTVSNTLAGAVALSGRIVRGRPSSN